MRKIFASEDIIQRASLSVSKKVEIYSFFPIDRASCECQSVVLEWKKKFASIPPNQKEQLIQDIKFLICPRGKAGMKHFKITCNNCGEAMGYCWATNATLKDWCDFHYVQWSDGKQWYGCLTPHISPITEELCLECCCGQDTRDFRANATLPYKTIMELEKEASIGREFGKALSKFKTSIISKTVLPFSLGG